MAFKEVSNSGSGIASYWPKKASERKVGDSITGVYKQKVERKDPSGETSVLYLLQTSEGVVGVNSTSMIARAFEQIPAESLVKIVFDGKAVSHKTGRSYNNFKVYLDDGEDAPKNDDIDLSNLDF